jgi:hypothetical protein
MRKHTVVFFAKTSELHILNKAILYARDNELCDRLIIIHVIELGSAIDSISQMVPERSPEDVSVTVQNSQSLNQVFSRTYATNRSNYSAKYKSSINTKPIISQNTYDNGDDIDSDNFTSTPAMLNEDMTAQTSTNEATKSSEIASNLRENLKVLDHVYPKVKIDLLLVTAEEFNPRLVAKLSEDLNIKAEFMFIRCPGDNFKYNIGEFEGVRTIMR